jgi:hypothetical protein
MPMRGMHLLREWMKMKVKHIKPAKEKTLLEKMYELMDYFDYTEEERRELLEAYMRGDFEDIGILG